MDKKIVLCFAIIHRIFYKFTKSVYDVGPSEKVNGTIHGINTAFPKEVFHGAKGAVCVLMGLHPSCTEHPEQLILMVSPDQNFSWHPLQKIQNLHIFLPSVKIIATANEPVIFILHVVAGTVQCLPQKGIMAVDIRDNKQFLHRMFSFIHFCVLSLTDCKKVRPKPDFC